MSRMSLLRILLSFLMIVTSPNILFAVTPLKEGQVAPTSGLLFSLPESQELKRNLLELDFLKAERDIFIKEDKLKSKEIENLKDINQILKNQKEELLSQNNTLNKQNTVIGIGGVILGMFIAGALTYATRSK